MNNLKIIESITEQTSTTEIEFAKSLKHCLEYLSKEAKDNKFENTQHILDVSVLAVDDDLEKITVNS